MIRIRRSCWFASFAALAGMLFLQAAMAFAACDLPQGAASDMAAAMAQPATPGCHDADKNTHLCLGHCQGEDRTFGKPQASLPDLSAAPSPIRIPGWRATPRHWRGRADARSAAAGPPPRILYQSFLL